jgi:ABC-type polysaccharide/polyol phosphate transport system ATPase subunit
MEVCGAAMMDERIPAIEVRSLRKRFRLQNAAIGSLKTALLWWKRRSVKEFEALKSISFDAYQGECVAVVGRNGAGKSTLLGLLAKVYKPTEGSFRVRGRLAPLLELGAGFHPDLTGIENIYFNAVVLGLTRMQVRERIQEIIAFSELGDAIHSPVRTYSSGMTARLGFAIAVHVDADVLLVDEVLSVGDFDFEQKCLRRVSDFRAAGGCILLVSHHLDTVRQFADRCLWLKAGEIVAEGTPSEILPQYLASS